jgi:hypothetical protein
VKTLGRGVARNARIPPVAFPANPLGLASKAPPKGHPYRMGCICINLPGVRWRSPLAKVLSARCDDAAAIQPRRKIFTRETETQFYAKEWQARESETVYRVHVARLP